MAYILEKLKVIHRITQGGDANGDRTIESCLGQDRTGLGR